MPPRRAPSDLDDAGALKLADRPPGYRAALLEG
jgi:hypothetical protein